MVQIGDQPSSLFNFKIVPVSAQKDLEDLGFYWEDGEWIKKQTGYRNLKIFEYSDTSIDESRLQR